MKRQLLHIYFFLSFLTFITISFQSVAQTEFGYGKGTIVKSNGDTINCYVEMALNYTENVKYKYEKEGSIVEMRISEVNTVITPYRTIRKIKTERFERLMTALVEEDESSLFVYVSNNQGRIDRDRFGGFVFYAEPEIIYALKIDDLFYDILRTNYKKILVSLLSSQPEIVNELKNKTFRFSSLEELIVRYNMLERKSNKHLPVKNNNYSKQKNLLPIPANYKIQVPYFSFHLEAQHGSYQMIKINELQEDQFKSIKDSLNISPSRIYTFPPYNAFGFGVSYSKKQHSYFLATSYNTTGGRLYYADYSGIIRIDKRVSGISTSVGYSYILVNGDKIRISIGIGIGATISTLKTENIIEIYKITPSTNSVANFSSFQLFGQPNLALTFSPNNFLFLQLKGEYYLQGYSSEMTSKSFNQSKISKEEKSINLDWSGFRLSAGIGVKFNRVEPNK